MKFDRDQIGMVVALVVVAVVATLVLGFADQFTRKPIAEARRAALHKALTQVLPAHANDPISDLTEISDEAFGDAQIHLARDAEGAVIAAAFETVAPDGYAGTIRILMGVRSDGSLQAIRITEHRETPGLGDGIVTNDEWLASFAGTTLSGTKWGVKKDGGEFDQFTGATITPRAVVRAVKRGLEFFDRHRDAILAGGVKAEAAAEAIVSDKEAGQ